MPKFPASLLPWIFAEPKADFAAVKGSGGRTSYLIARFFFLLRWFARIFLPLRVFMRRRKPVIFLYFKELFLFLIFMAVHPCGLGPLGL
jgi:hypothetical protein